jgi:hypothetical protein
MTDDKKEIVAYTYKYECPRWYGVLSGIRNIIGKTPEEALDLAKKDANEISGSQTCKVALLQKFHLSIKLAEPYPALIQCPLSNINK